MVEQKSSSIRPATAVEPETKLVLRKWLTMEVMLLCWLIVGMWVLLSLPIIFYYIPIPEIPSNLSANRTVAFDGSVCSESVQYAASSGICQMELFNLLTSSNCAPGLEGNLLVMRNEEARALQLINGLTILGASDECIRKAVPFLCLFLFGLCGESGISIQPSSSQCEQIRDNICQEQWMNVERFGIELPECAKFPSEVPYCPSLNDSYSINGTVTRNMAEHPNGRMVPDLECTDGFYQENGSNICTPSCYTWLQFSKQLSILRDVIVFSCTFIGSTAAVAVITISCVAHKRMFIFPSVLVVFMSIDLLVLGLFIMVGYFDRNKLYCSSRSLIKSLSKVTPFCVISGMVFSYVIGQLALWWLFHVTYLFWKIVLPFHSHFYGKMKCINIMCIVVGILLPLVPIITSMADFAADLWEKSVNITFQQRNSLFLSGGLGYRSTAYPPILCTVSNPDVKFYTFILPINFILASGCTMILIVLLSVHRHFKRKREQHDAIFKIGESFKFGTAEKKLLIVFCYYVLLTVMSLTALTLFNRISSQSMQSIQRNFICEQGGRNRSNPCSRSDIEDLSNPSVNTLSFILLALFPVINLLYVVSIQELKELWRKRR